MATRKKNKPFISAIVAAKKIEARCCGCLPRGYALKAINDAEAHKRKLEGVQDGPNKNDPSI